MQTLPLSYTKVYESTLKIFLEDKEGKEQTIEISLFFIFFDLIVTTFWFTVLSTIL